jgi:riboflavin kinase/FMN adenylyltransferase
MLETFLFDFTGDLYDRHLAIDFIAYLRPEAKFDSLDALIAQMDKDSEAAKQLLRQDTLP